MNTDVSHNAPKRVYPNAFGEGTSGNPSQTVSQPKEVHPSTVEIPAKAGDVGKSTKIVLNFGRFNNQKQTDERECADEQSLSYEDDSDIDRDSDDDLSSSIKDSGSGSPITLSNPVIAAPIYSSS